MNLSKSPDKSTLQKEVYISRMIENGETPNQDYIDMFDDALKMAQNAEADPEWKIDNLEYDLRSTDWILEKARNSETYAQHIYAALCNIKWQKIDVMPILKDEWWSCSWRYAGGIVADMRQTGDYLDWYCSGYRDRMVLDDESFNALSKEEQEKYIQDSKLIESFLAEGIVTEEIAEDFRILGWQWSECD
jgi:hypothetical protein